MDILEKEFESIHGARALDAVQTRSVSRVLYIYTLRFLKLDYRQVAFDDTHDFNSLNVESQTGNGAQILFLEDKRTRSRLMVGNTHLYWRPDASAIKIKQACILLENILEMNKDHQCPMVLCGGEISEIHFLQIGTRRQRMPCTLS